MGSLQKGRFISKGEQERYKDIEVAAYSFGELVGDEMLIPDNPRKSLVQKKLHTEHEIAHKVHDYPQMRAVLQARSTILNPEDLNVDFARTQEELRIKNRRKMMDEEEAVAQELADMMERNRESLEQVSWKVGAKESSAKPSNKRETAVAAAEMAEASEARPEKVHAAAAFASAAGVRESQNQQVSHGEKPVMDKALEHFHAAQNEAELEELKAKIATEIREEVRRESYEEGFQQGRTAGMQAGREEGIAQGQEQGSRLGYEDGFRSGEQRGEIAGEAKVDKTLSLIGEIAHQIDILRSEIVASGQEIFVEFAKVASESILRSQLSLRDETLRNFLLHTMTPFTEKAFLTIDVNGVDVKRVMRVLKEYPDLEKKVKVRENRELAVGDFRVEADNEVVIVDLKKAVNDFMESIKSEIFAENAPKEEAS